MADMRGIRKGALASARPLLLALSLAACGGEKQGTVGGVAIATPPPAATSATVAPQLANTPVSAASPSPTSAPIVATPTQTVVPAASAPQPPAPQPAAPQPAATPSPALRPLAPQPPAPQSPGPQAGAAKLSTRLQQLADLAAAGKLPATLQAMSQLVSLPATGGGSLSGTADGKLTVEVRLSDVGGSAVDVSARGFAVLVWAPQFATANLSVEPARLAELASTPGVLSVEEVLRPGTNSGGGSIR